MHLSTGSLYLRLYLSCLPTGLLCSSLALGTLTYPRTHSHSFMLSLVHIKTTFYVTLLLVLLGPPLPGYPPSFFQVLSSLSYPDITTIVKLKLARHWVLNMRGIITSRSRSCLFTVISRFLGRFLCRRFVFRHVHIDLVEPWPLVIVFLYCVSRQTQTIIPSGDVQATSSFNPTQLSAHMLSQRPEISTAQAPNAKNAQTPLTPHLHFHWLYHNLLKPNLMLPELYI